MVQPNRTLELLIRNMRGIPGLLETVIFVAFILVAYMYSGGPLLNQIRTCLKPLYLMVNNERSFVGLSVSSMCLLLVVFAWMLSFCDTLRFVVFWKKVYSLPSDCYTKNFSTMTSRRGKNKKTYSPNDLTTAVKAVQDGSMNAYQASNTFGVPRRTISYRVKKAREKFLRSLDMMEVSNKKIKPEKHSADFLSYEGNTDEQVYLLIDDESENLHREESENGNEAGHSNLKMFITDKNRNASGVEETISKAKTTY